MASTQANPRKRKKPNNDHNPLSGLTFSDFGISPPSTSNLAVIRSEALSDDRRRISRTELPVPIPSELGSVRSSPAPVPDPAMEPLCYYEDGDKFGLGKREEPVKRVQREKSVRIPSSH